MVFIGFNLNEHTPTIFIRVITVHAVYFIQYAARLLFNTFSGH